MIVRMLRELVQAQEGKAIPYVPWLTDAGGPVMGSGSGYYGAYNPYNGASGAISFGRAQTPLSQREAGIHLQTYGGSEGVDWLFNAVNFIVQSASSANYHFVAEGGVEQVLKLGPSDPLGTKTADPLLAKLFANPNPYQQWAEFLEISLIDFLLVGNAYWVKWRPTDSGQPIALYRMHPAMVRIVPDKFGPAKYLYRLPGDARDTEFTPDQVIQFKRPNPHSPMYGLGIVRGGSTAIDMELALSQTMASYYQKRGLPSGVVQTERRVPRDVFNKLKMQLKSFYTGPSNAGQLMVLEAGLKYSSISPSAADALFHDMGGWSRDRVLAMFHLNKGLLGQHDGRGLAELSTWQQLFDTKTMVPLLSKFQSLISCALTQPGWGVDFAFDYNEVQAPDDIIKRANLLAALPGVKVRELREAAGLNPSTGDTTVDEMVLNLPGENMDANGQGGTADRNLLTEPGRPPLPQNTSAIRRTAGVPPAVAGGNSGKSVDQILEDLDFQLKLMGVKALPPANVHVGDITGLIPPVDTLYPTRFAAIDDLVAEVERDIVKAATALERELLDASEGKAAGSTMYQRIKASKGWAAFTTRLEAILTAAVEQALSLANRQHVTAGLEPKLDMNYGQIAQEFVSRAQGGAQSITDTFQKEVLADVLRNQQRGGPTTDLANSLRQHVHGWAEGRAQKVALTEATRAYNEGTLQVAEANGIGTVIVSDGDTHDQPCKDANGATWTLEQARDNLIEHPSCRRAFVPSAALAS